MKILLLLTAALSLAAAYISVLWMQGHYVSEKARDLSYQCLWVAIICAFGAGFLTCSAFFPHL
jgi:hypothetical protein